MKYKQFMSLPFKHISSYSMNQLDCNIRLCSTVVKLFCSKDLLLAMKLTIHLHQGQDCMELYHHFPMHIHSVVFH